MLKSIEYESYLELKPSFKIKIKFESFKIETFWIAKESDYNELSVFLLPFAIFYLCKTAISVYTKTKNTFWNQLNAVSTNQRSGIIPDLKTIMKITMDGFQSSIIETIKQINSSKPS